jgi:membrane protease subunit (stomatin/prohibitin family)
LPSQIFGGFAGKQVGMNLPSTVQKEENKLTLTQVQQQQALAKKHDKFYADSKEAWAKLNLLPDHAFDCGIKDPTTQSRRIN